MTDARRVVVGALGGPDVLRVERTHLPEPGPGQALVRMRAAGLSYADLLLRSGRYPGGDRPPFVTGWDLVGTVDSLGPTGPRSGDHGVQVGQRVAAYVRRGGHGTHLLVPSDALVALPDGVDDAQAACLPLNYLTAYQMLHRVARVRPGQRVLVHGASGGVGTALLELAALAGARAHGTASSHKLHAVVRHGGVPVDRRRPDLTEHLGEAVPGGFDAAFVAGDRRAVETARASVRPGGLLVSYGGAVGPGRARPPSVLAALPELARLRLRSLTGPVRVRSYHSSRAVARRPEQARTDLVSLVDLLAAGRVAPVVAARVPLAEAGEAHRMLASGDTVGRIVLVP